MGLLEFFLFNKLKQETTSPIFRASMTDRALTLHPYHEVSANWPNRASGCNIIASYTEDAVLVYQAFKDEIADYAVKNQKFEGCPHYNATRMTWIKTNFLWMMKRSGYASKCNQTRILGIWLKKSAFEDMLSKARFKGRGAGKARLQWDPDYTPEFMKIKRRRCIQLGIKGRTSFQTGEDIVEIVDCTALAHESKANRTIPAERVYVPEDKTVRNYIYNFEELQLQKR